MSTANSFTADPERAAQESRRYMFTVELKAGSRTEYTWNPTDASYIKKPVVTDNENEAVRQVLVIRRAVIGASAKDNEVNIVMAEVTDPEAETATFPMVHLVKGSEPQSAIDLTFPEVPDVQVKFTLVEGTGPVHLIGHHFVERITSDPDYDAEAEEDEEQEGEGDEEMAEEVLAKTTEAIRANAKRRLQGDQNGESTAKKIKVGSENGNGNDVEMEKDDAKAKSEAATGDAATAAAE